MTAIARPAFLLACALALLPCRPAPAQDFPQSFRHKFGETVIETRPERVATVDFAGADDLLALGIQPVTLRDWYGGFEGALWPWAAPLVTGSPAILRGEINYEQIAAARPDVIIALWSGIGSADYERLSRIAPVVAVPEGTGDFALPWDERALIAGRAVGREDEARRQVEAIRARTAAIAAAHPDWQGRTVSLAYFIAGSLGAYTARDVRVQIMAELGFVEPPELAALTGAGDGFSVPLSEEALPLLDADLILWVLPDGDRTAPDRLVTRRFLAAARQGREVLAGKLMTGAISHASLLSLPWALDRLEPALAEALAGNGPVAIE